MPFNERQHLAVLFAIIKYQGSPSGNEWAEITALLPGNPKINTVRERFRRFKIYAKREHLLEQVNAPEPKVAKKFLAKHIAAGVADAKGKAKPKSVVILDEEESGIEEDEEDNPAGAKATRSIGSASEEEEEEFQGDEMLLFANDHGHDASASAPALSSPEKVMKAGNPQDSTGEIGAKSPTRPSAHMDDGDWEAVEVKRTPSPGSAKNGVPMANVKTSKKNGVADDDEESSELDREVVRESPLRKKKKTATFRAVNKK